MSVLTVIVIVAVIGLLALQSLVNARYLRWYHSRSSEPPIEQEFPRAAIILSLRGADPSLEECLNRLNCQNYPDYEIHVILDHETDPAGIVVARWRTKHRASRLHVHILRSISKFAYLKTSAIRQCLQHISPSVGAAIMVDADTVVHPNWLRDMVAPMSDRNVGLVYRKSMV